MSALPSREAVEEATAGDAQPFSGALHVAFEALPGLPALASAWQQQEARTPGSFFTSWTWIGTWVETLGDRAQLRWMKAFDGDGELVAMGIIGQRRHWRFGVFPVLSTYLHETGLPDCDGITIEYNGLLVRDEARSAVTSAMVTALMNEGMDQLRLPGVMHVPVVESRALHVTATGRRAFFIDLRAITEANTDYLSVLKQRSRYLVRKSIKRLTEKAHLRLDVAETTAEASDFLASLMALHTRYWQAKGQPGAFGSEFQRRFHERIVTRAVPRGEVVLMALMQGDRPVGYFYYFVFAGWVHYYQSGIDYEHYEASDSPGLAAHALAIEYFRGAGLEVYDFMPGEQQYKRTLATRQGMLQWVTVSQRSLKMRMVRALHHRARVVRDRLRTRPVLASAAAADKAT